MITVVTDNLDEHTILSLTVSTLANVYCERPTPVAKLNRNVLCEEFDDIKHSHQYTRNLHSFILSQCGYHHVELDEESSYLTTFATPFSRYRCPGGRLQCEMPGCVCSKNV